MDKIYNAQITTQIERSMERAWLLFAQLPNAQVYEHGDILYYFTGIPDNLLNAVLRYQTQSNSIESKIELIKKWFLSKQVPFSWYTSSFSQHKNLEQQLLLHGFTFDEELTGMALDITNTNVESRYFPHNFSVVRVDSELLLREWIRVFETAFPTSQLFSEAMAQILSRNLFEKTNDENYLLLGLVNNEPVATTTLSIFENEANIYDVSVLPSFRGFGIGTSITNSAISIAKKLQASYIFLQSSKMGLSVYRQLGFKDYCEFKRFVYSGSY